MGEDFQGRLLPGERMVWEGGPPTGFLLTGRDVFLIPFSLFWCGFITFWMWGATTATRAGPANTEMWFFPLFGIPFVLIGVYFLIGRFFVDAWVRGQTRYGVTNRRVLVLRRAPFTKFAAFAIDRLPELTLEERNNGRGTIRFQQRLPMWGGYNNNWSSWTPGLDTGQFLLIAGARGVFDQIQKLVGGG
jgi:hypothetical protein